VMIKKIPSLTVCIGKVQSLLEYTHSFYVHCLHFGILNSPSCSK
jgi:hypothetical protein